MTTDLVTQQVQFKRNHAHAEADEDFENTAIDLVEQEMVPHIRNLGAQKVLCFKHL